MFAPLLSNNSGVGDRELARRKPAMHGLDRPVSQVASE